MYEGTPLYGPSKTLLAKEPDIVLVVRLGLDSVTR